MNDPLDTPPPMDTARAVIEVTAGVIPGEAMPEYSRRWGITGSEWRQAQDDERAGELLATMNGKAQGYAAMLMLQPDRLNWVRAEWIWC